MFSLRSSSLALGASTTPSRTLRLQSRFSARAVANVTLLATMLVVSSGCASLSRKEKGAAIGAAAGGAAGAAVGRANGSTAKGAILGAIVGGAAGAIIGHQMDQQALELKSKIPGATVERVGEGIQVTFASGLMFGFDSTAIRPQAAENLRNLASSLKEYPDTDLLIVGHTDASGTDSYNLDLSSRRARAAADYLGVQGVPMSRLRVIGRGEAEPIASNDTDNGQQLNRRIEIAIFARAGAKSSRQ